MEPKYLMLIKAIPYDHQVDAFKFTCRLFGFAEGGDAKMSKEEAMSKGVALLME